MENAIERYTGKEAKSFKDLRFNLNHLKKDELIGGFRRLSKVPVYVVNKRTGHLTMYQPDEVEVTFARNLYFDKAFCSICVVKNKPFRECKAFFHITEDTQYDDKAFIDNISDLWAGNCVLFLHQVDAAIYARKILWDKKIKIDGEINALNDLINF